MNAGQTTGRVAAGAVAEKYLAEAYGVEIVAFVSSVGKVHIPRFPAERLAPDASSASQSNGTTSHGAVDNFMADDVSEAEAEEPLSQEFRELLQTITRAKVDENDIRCPHPQAAERMRAVSFYTLADPVFGLPIPSCIENTCAHPAIGQPAYRACESEP